MEGRQYSGKYASSMERSFIIPFSMFEYGPHKFIMADTFSKWYEKLRNFTTKDTDVWVVTFPKAGTTWTQEMVWCILHSLDFEGAEQLLMKRFPFFEWDSHLPEIASELPLEEGDPCAPGNSWNIIQTLKDPRTFKSHLHLALLPKDILTSGAKIVYVCRDPKDVCVSYFYHQMKLEGFIGEFDDFVQFFLNGLLRYSPFWKHVLDFWHLREHPNVLYLTYEELQQDLPKSIVRVANFLGKELHGEQIQKLTEHLSFDKMKDNYAVNNEALVAVPTEQSEKLKFMRKGKVGDWKNHLSTEQTRKFEEWTEDALKGTDFPYYRNNSLRAKY